MEPDRRNQISDLYHAALTRAPEERSAFLKGACSGDEALRQEVESLLGYESDVASFLETPAAAGVVGAPGRTGMLNRRLGSYTIVAPLGAGGMGEVYRARDSKLGRDVAIKILPSHFTSDPERRARFAREARLLATLNHPHIGAIYGLEESDGQSALVLELVEGPTLADRLERGPLPIPEALAIARQVAEALDAAHEKGIVHRDLKPGNIVLQSSANAAGVPSSETRAKVLDFGLAKTMAVGLEGDLTRRPPGSLDGTEEGRILGTPAYMSPEQARGQAVDKRTDIWAFGCVLYEMLAGRRPFEGKTITDTLAQILEREPDWSALPAATPRAVRKLLRRCLMKDRSYRSRDIGDVRLELEKTTPRSRYREVVLAALALVILAPLVWLAARSYPRQASSSVAKASVPAPVETPLQLTRLTFDDGLQTDPALSSDGRFVAYASNRKGNFDIYTQPVGAGNPVPITDHPAHDWQPDWSVKDQIVFRSEREGGGLYVVAQTGGNEQRVAKFGNRPKWSPDGEKILFEQWPAGTTYIVGLDGVAPHECNSCSALAQGWSRDGRHSVVAYGWFRNSHHISMLSTSPAPQFQPRLGIIDVESGVMDEWTLGPAVLRAFRELSLATRSSEPLAWALDGNAVYFTGDSRGLAVIWKLDVNPETRTVTGGPHRITTMAEDTTGVTIASATGDIAFGAATRTPRLWSYPLDSSGRRIAGPSEALTSSATESNYPAITPDGRRFVFSVQRPGGLGAWELRMRTLPERLDRVLRVDSAREWRTTPQLSPDGRHVVFRYVPSELGGGAAGPQQLRLLDLDSDEESELTTISTGVVLPNGWSADGRYVAATFDRQRREPDAKGMAIGLLPVAGKPNAERSMKVVTTSDGYLFQPSISRDGRWIAFRVGSGTDPRQIAVLGSKDGQWAEPQDQRNWRYLESDGAAARDKPRWSVDGRLLYFTSSRGGLNNVWAVDFNPISGVFGRPFQVTEFTGPGEQMPSRLEFFEIAVARGRLVVPTIHPAGGIWRVHRAR